MHSSRALELVIINVINYSSVPWIGYHVLKSLSIL